MHNYMRAGGLFPHSAVDGAAELTVLEYRLELCDFSILDGIMRC
jgi:hypothetical protein